MGMTQIKHAKFQIGQVVRHRLFPFRGVIFDVDPEFANTEEWYESIPEEARPHRDQPFTICSRKTRNPNMSPMYRSRTWCLI